MHFKLYFPLLALSCLAVVHAQTTITTVSSLRAAISSYKTAFARFQDIDSDCERSLTRPISCNAVFANVARDIASANSQLDRAAQLFAPKVPCATISAVFSQLLGNITRVNDLLQGVACSKAPETIVAAKLNGPALQANISLQIPKIDLLGQRFAANNACNNKQSAAALKKFADAVKVIDASDKKTAQAFNLVDGTLSCI